MEQNENTMMTEQMYESITTNQDAFGQPETMTPMDSNSEQPEEILSKNMEKPAEGEAKPSIEDMAAHDYKILLKQFKNKLHVMSRRQQQRVIEALIEFPFENQKPHFSYPEERDLFYIGTSIADCQFVMKRCVYEMMQDKGKMEEFKNDLEQLEQKKKEQEGKVNG